MASAAAAVFPQIANFNPQGFVQGNQLQQQQIGLTASQAAAEQARVPLIQQQTQQTGLQNQLVQQQINDQKAIGRAWAQWDPDQDPSGQGLLRTAVRNGATPQSVMGVQQHLAAYNASLATADKTRLENQKMRDDDYAGKMQAIIDADPTKQEELWQAHVADFAKDAPGEQLPPHFTAQDAKTFLNLHQFRSQQIENELKQRQAQEAVARTRESEAKATRQETINKLIDTGNQAAKNGQHPIDAISAAGATDPSLTAILQGFKASYDALGQTPPDENGRRPAQDATVEAAARAAAQYREKLSPQLRQAEVATTVAKETDPRILQARQNLAVNTEAAKLRLQQSLSTDIFAGIASPTDRTRATAEYQKLGNDYIEKMESAQGLHDLIAQAQGGNKAAPGLISIAELRTYLNRVNRTELQAVGSGAGNLLDRVQGVVGGLVEGQPVPPDIMQGVDQIATMQQQATQRKYDNQLGLLGTTYNKGQKPPAFQWQPHSGQQQAQPAQPGGVPAAVQSVLSKAGPGIHTLSDGSRWMKAADGTITKQ